ncbi:MAG: hypothetical protein JNJ57_14630 [Saprospiraceae bacterium]|nr:hypothetical protein [Saprospiraceae bacterium]
MNNAAKTVYYFSFYLFLVGATLIITPNTLLGLFGFDPTSEVWIRVVGVLAVTLGIYYYRMSGTNNRTFLQTTIIGRSAAASFFLLFVLAGWTKPALIGFAAVDMLGALWTWQALKKTIN